jgi:CubicO group peptidase (beta-lactamase class C family)
VCLSAAAGTVPVTAARADHVPLPPTSAVVAAPAELQAVRAGVLERIAGGALPSMAIGVVRGGEVIWQEALGWADREARIPATSEIRYPVASVSKSITATGAVAMAARGKLRLMDMTWYPRLHLKP